MYKRALGAIGGSQAAPACIVCWTGSCSHVPAAAAERAVAAPLQILDTIKAGSCQSCCSAWLALRSHSEALAMQAQRPDIILDDFYFPAGSVLAGAVCRAADM